VLVTIVSTICETIGAAVLLGGVVVVRIRRSGTTAY
jgi:hypothetical protein